MLRSWGALLVLLLSFCVLSATAQPLDGDAKRIAEPNRRLEERQRVAKEEAARAATRPAPLPPKPVTPTQPLVAPPMLQPPSSYQLFNAKWERITPASTVMYSLSEWDNVGPNAEAPTPLGGLIADRASELARIAQTRLDDRATKVQIDRFPADQAKKAIGVCRAALGRTVSGELWVIDVVEREMPAATSTPPTAEGVDPSRSDEINSLTFGRLMAVCLLSQPGEFAWTDKESAELNRLEQDFDAKIQNAIALQRAAPGGRIPYDDSPAAINKAKIAALQLWRENTINRRPKHVVYCAGDDAALETWHRSDRVVVRGRIQTFAVAPTIATQAPGLANGVTIYPTEVVLRIQPGLATTKPAPIAVFAAPAAGPAIRPNPPVVAAPRPPRRIVFILDASGSMLNHLPEARKKLRKL